MKKVMKVIAAGIVCTCIFCFGKAIRDKTAKVYQQFCEETEPEEWIDFNLLAKQKLRMYMRGFGFREQKLTLRSCRGTRMDII